MTKAEFQELPGLLMEHQVIALGYSRATLEKFVACRVLQAIQPPGSGQKRFQKRQLALLMGWKDMNDLDEQKFAAEPLLMRSKAVQWYTGMSETSLGKLVSARTLRLVRPPGSREGKYLKEQIAVLVGMKC